MFYSPFLVLSYINIIRISFDDILIHTYMTVSGRILSRKARNRIQKLLHWSFWLSSLQNCFSFDDCKAVKVKKKQKREHITSKRRNVHIFFFIYKTWYLTLPLFLRLLTSCYTEISKWKANAGGSVSKSKTNFGPLCTCHTPRSNGTRSFLRLCDIWFWKWIPIYVCV